MEWGVEPYEECVSVCEVKMSSVQCDDGCDTLYY